MAKEEERFDARFDDSTLNSVKLEHKLFTKPKDLRTILMRENNFNL